MGKTRFKDLTDQEKSYIRTVHANKDLGWDHRMSILMNKFGISERTTRKWIEKLGFSSYKEIENEEIRQGKLREYDKSKKRYIITWAQNATPVHKQFWDNILTYADELNANVGVIQGRYQNPTSLWSESMRGAEWWDEEFTVYKKWPSGNLMYQDSLSKKVIPEGDEHLTMYTNKYNHEGKYELLDDDDPSDWRSRQVYNPTQIIDFTYLDAGRHNIHAYVDLLSDVKIRPTAVNPLTGFEGISGDRSSILGHPRVHLRSLPVLRGHGNKLIMTTGACTIKNYTDTKAGKKSEFHHTYGFVIVEVKDNLTYYVRQVTAEDNGSFIDLNNKVSDGKVEKIDKCDAFVMGDIHAANVDESIVEATVGLFDKIKPTRIIMHDVFDGESVNHHENKDPIKSFERYKNGKNLLAKEINGLTDLIDKYNLIKYNPIIVRSNHDVWLEKWIKEGDWKKDIPNAQEYMEYALALLKGDAPKGIVPYVLDNKYGDDITTLDLDDSFKINGWELGQHGHLGTHGSKGNLEQFRKLNTKIIVGDYHQPGRKDGAVGVGTYSKLRLGYNKGASAWMHAGAILHTNGKVQHVIFQNGGFTTLL